MNTSSIDPQFEIIHKAIVKIHPEYIFFLDDLMNHLIPFWKGEQDQSQAHFIHLIGFGKRSKAREILTDLLELLDWQNNSIVLWQSPDRNRPSPLSQAKAFEEAFPVFPKVMVTDFLYDFFYEYQFEDQLCWDGKKLIKFLQERKELNLLEFNQNPAQAGGSLVISFIPGFQGLDHVDVSLLLHYLWKHPCTTMEDFRRDYQSEDLKILMDKKYLRKKELIFFSKDGLRKIQLVFDLMSLYPQIEAQGSTFIGVPVTLSLEAVSHFQVYIAHKKLSYQQLKREAFNFFDPVFRQYPRLIQKLPSYEPKSIEVDFNGGWRFQVITD